MWIPADAVGGYLVVELMKEVYIYMSFNKFYKMLNNGINMHAFHVGLNIFSPPCFQLHVGHTSIVSLVGVKF